MEKECNFRFSFLNWKNCFFFLFDAKYRSTNLIILLIPFINYINYFHDLFVQFNHS